jgi:hypothetical protein
MAAPLPAPEVPTPATPPAPGPAPEAAQPEAAPRLAPPVRSAEPPRETSPAPERDTAEARRLHQEAAAQAFVQEYLAFWSAPNNIALEAQREFYATSVNFHGQERSARSVFDEKRRFVRRWPERSYTPRPGSMEAACDGGSDLCTVRSVFDFRAADPQRGRRSEGTGTLEVVISFAGREPVIISETSFVNRRGQDRTVSLEELTD